MGDAVGFLHRAIELDPVYSWTAHNARSYLSLLKDAGHIVTVEQAQNADLNGILQRYCDDTVETIKKISEYVIPQLEAQISFLSMHKLIDRKDDLFVQLLGTIKIYQKILDVMHKNLDTASRVGGKGMIRLGAGIDLDALTKGIEITVNITESANNTGIKHDQNALRNMTQTLNFTSRGLALSEIVAIGGFLIEVEIYELQEEDEDWFGTVFSTILGVAQIFVGLAVIAMGGVFVTSFGMSLVLGGIGDLISSAIGVTSGKPIDLEGYLHSKGISIGISLATAGLMGFASTIPSLQNLPFMEKIITNSKLTNAEGIAGQINSVGKLAFIMKTAAIQTSVTLAGAALYNVVKGGIEPSDVSEKVDREVNRFIESQRDVLRKIFASDEWNDINGWNGGNNKALFELLSKQLEYIINKYSRRFTDDGTRFSTGVAEGVAGAALGGFGVDDAKIRAKNPQTEVKKNKKFREYEVCYVVEEKENSSRTRDGKNL